MKKDNSLFVDFMHKVFLINEIEKKGYEKASLYKTGEELNFIKSIKDKNLHETLQKLKKKFFSDEVMLKIKLIQRIIKYGYDEALNYANIGEEERFTKKLKYKTKEELIEEYKKLKNKLK